MPDKPDRLGADPKPLVDALDSTLELLDRARRGDDGALERLFARHLEPLRRFASGRLPAWARDLPDTDDLVQDTLLRTFKRMESFEPRRVGALQAYLRQAVVNRLRDELRRRSRQPPHRDLDPEIASNESPLERAIGREALASYERALARLRPADREAIVGRIELALSWEELAIALEKPTPGAARKAAQRALVRLAEEMERGE